MVGVPGRSKGCNTCKQRKIACSLEKPECRTCIKSGRTCAGYQRERIFLLDHRTKGDGPRTYQKPQVNPAPTPRSAPKKRKEATVPQQGGQPSTSLIISHSNSISRTLSPSSRLMYRQQILNEFLSLASPTVRRIAKHEFVPESSAFWHAIIPSSADISPALETSVMALCTASVGRSNNDHALVHESLKFYTRGLWELQRALWDPNVMYEDETLAACMILVTYEVTECPDQGLAGWLKHMKGCSKLFELRGPKAYDSEVSYQLFTSFRLLEIQQAITERRHTFLSGPQWLSLPWKAREKSKYHQFLDSMALLPDVIADGYDIIGAVVNPAETTPPDPISLMAKILGIVNRTWQLDAEFKEFYTEFKRENLGQLYWPELSQGTITTADEEELGKVFPVAYQFLNMSNAHICMLYWASNAILWSGMSYIYKVIAGLLAMQAASQSSEEGTTNRSENSTTPRFSVDMLPPLEHRADISTMAKNIAQSVEFALLNDNLNPWTTRAVFPLKVSIESFHDSPGCEREQKWALAAMGKILGGGVRILGHVEDDKWAEHAFLPG